MARKTVRVSDQSGDVIPDGRGATLRVTYADARRGAFQADLTDDEAEAIRTATKAQPAARRGRKPKAAA